MTLIRRINYFYLNTVIIIFPILAAKCGHADVFDVFAKTGVSLRQPSSKIGMTALHIAGKNDNYTTLVTISR